MVPEDVELVKHIVLSQYGGQDLLGWNYTDDGMYTVKSGYWLSIHSQDQQVLPPRGSTGIKAALWKLNTAPKLKHFLWRILSEVMPVGSILKRRRVSQDSVCRKCCVLDEDMEHLFFKCPYTQAFWRGANLPDRTFTDNSISFEEKLKAIVSSINNKALNPIDRQQPLWILWRIWKSRNLLVYGRKQTEWKVDLKQAQHEAREWTQVLYSNESNSNTTQRLSGRHKQSMWERPPCDYVKINYDGSRRQNMSTGGWIFRDAQGFFLGGGQGKQSVNGDGSLETELQALLMAMQHTWTKGYRKVIFEGDNKQVQELLTTSKRNFHMHNWILEIKGWKEKFEDAEFRWIPREDNKAADHLAKQFHNSQVSFNSIFYVPVSITQFLHEDISSSL